MCESTRYVTLMCALPHHGPLFGATRPPLSRIRLNEYLRQLEPADRADYDTVSLLLDWSRQTRSRDDARILHDARELVPSLSCRLAREVVQWRLELRSAMAALRRRRRGESAPPTGRHWGYGRWLPTMARHWSEPDLGLGQVYPWIGEARALLNAGASVELERLLLGAVWQDLERRSEGHEFDFEAVLLYCMRWEVVARWTRYQAEGAATRFEYLVREALADVDLDAIAA
jgi:hypothetical protein